MAPGDRWVYRETDAEGGDAAGRGDCDRPRRRRSSASRRASSTTSSPRTARSSRTRSTGTRRTPTGTSGTSARTRRSTRTARSKTTEGSWEAGVDGAAARRSIVPAEPEPGSPYRAGVLRRRGGGRRRGAHPRRAGARSRTARTTTCSMTKDTRRLEPDVVEQKFYAQGVGPVLEVTISGGVGPGGAREPKLRPSTSFCRTSSSQPLMKSACSPNLPDASLARFGTES